MYDQDLDTNFQYQEAVMWKIMHTFFGHNDVGSAGFIPNGINITFRYRYVRMVENSSDLHTSRRKINFTRAMKDFVAG